MVFKQELFSASKKYLLACSGGVDSIALFHLLLEHNIDFEVATVNYNFREEAKKEIDNINNICNKNNIQLHLFENKKIFSSNIEKKARDIRYDFFSSLMQKNEFEALVTGHNLNDKVEWFLMQFTKGAGINELTGMEAIGDFNGFKTLKPLVETERSEIENYIKNNNILSFQDSSNFDVSYHPVDNPKGIKRNYFRHNFSNELTKNFKDGINKTFSILGKEKKRLKQYKITKKTEKCFVIELFNENDDNALQAIDVVLKKYFEHLLNAKQREQIISQKEKGIVINNIAIGWIKDKILITPYIKKLQSFKDFLKEEKELFRKNKIPPKNRKFLKSIGVNIEDFI